MGFFDNYQDLGGGGSWLKSAEKQVLIENGISFEITKVVRDDENEFGPRWVAFCTIPDEDTGEDTECKIGFPINSGVDGRDTMLGQMSEYLNGDNPEPVIVKLDKPGKAILIVPADPPAKPKAKTTRAKAAAK